MLQDNSNTVPRAHPVLLAGAGVLFASVCFGLVPLFTRNLTEQGMAPHAVAFYRYILAAVILFPVLVRQRRHWRELLWGVVAGMVMGVGWVGYVQALETVPVSTVGVLYMTYPVFTVAIAWIMFGDAPTRRALVAALLIIAAAVIAGSPAALGPDQVPALVVSLAAPFGFGFGICVLVHRLSRIVPLARIGSVSLGSLVGLVPLMLGSDATELLPQDRSGWYLIGGISIATAFVPQLIYSICSPIVGTARTAILGSIELPTMFAVAVLAFGQPITPAQAIACILVLSAILLPRSRVTRNVTSSMTQGKR